MTEEWAIEATGLTKSYGAVAVLRGIDLAVRPGTVFSLLGPNGAGKTTMVRILATLVQTDSGRARVAGFDVVSHQHHVRRRISLTGQYAAVDELQTGLENLIMMGGCAISLGRRPVGGRTSSSTSSTWPTPVAGGWRPTPAGCVGGSTWPPPWSADRRSSSSTSRARASTSAADKGCGTSSPD